MLGGLPAGPKALGHLVGDDASERDPADTVGAVGLMLAKDLDVVLREFPERGRFGPLLDHQRFARHVDAVDRVMTRELTGQAAVELDAHEQVERGRAPTLTQENWARA